MKRNVLLITGLTALLPILNSCKEDGKQPIAEVVSQEIKIQPTEFSTKYDAEIDKIIAQMTPEEKIGMLHGNSMFTTTGVERLHIPELKMGDGPLGVREELERDTWTPLGLDNDFATFFPAGGGLSATWNPEMAALFGKSIGAEARARGKDILLAPAINIIRTPVGGRTFEYFSEDPFLNAMIAVPYTTGVQSQDVGVCIKHYAVNNQETNRGTVDVLLDERTLREIYLPAFKATIDAGAYSVMGAYNKLRGHYLCENEYMLQDILKGEWGFKGIVISDWAAVHSSVKSVENGLDIEMGSNLAFDDFYLANPLLDSLKAGKIDEKTIDGSVKRIMRVMFNLKRMGDTLSRKKGGLNTPEHIENAYKIASESIVLLKNTENLLPLSTDNLQSIAVIGDNAERKFASGGFGAGVKTKSEVSAMEGLKNRLPENITINYAQGYKESYDDNQTNMSYGRKLSYEADEAMIAEAVEAATKSDVAVIFAGSNRSVESEAADRETLQLPFGQEKLIAAVKNANPKTIVVIIAGGPFDLRKVEQSTSALIWSWFNGSEGGNALADVILGNINPSGKLPWTLPKELKDSPAHATNSFPGDESVTYKEGILVGYRWFDTQKIEPLYPFGYGLSYTDFQYNQVNTDMDTYDKNATIHVNVKISNSGSIDGKETVQLYVSQPGSNVDKAFQELKAFNKVAIKAGETLNVPLSFKASDLAYYDESKSAWVVEPGTYTLRIGSSSRDIRGEQTISIK
ncbi:beta-glucosidase family protein [Robertkochia solimangrovi]|uniref:beta-glucosidase family protein n=1 Tax=Robertkochia solimangrovi TaxID=2213046 RepID=UPI00117F8FF0|nr:glycoside hydrolase family 3 C-terminal domain-containing protein [Robertkochia solimangrovi]TRZ42296.1 glycosyl hydrolase [Robertkochia solimangrovi]